MTNTRVIIASTLVACAMMISCGDDNNNYPQPAPTPTPEIPTSGDVRVITTTSNRAKDLSESWIDFS